MSGKLYLNDPKLNKAFADGRRANQLGAVIGTNPHGSGTPQKAAWDDGWNNTFTTG